MKKTLYAAFSLLALLAAIPAWAGLNLGSTPLYLGASVQPIVMLNLPRDHQLYVKAYNDFSDLDGDGVIETEYKHSVNYYGYFDSFKCYAYDTANNRFNPFGITVDKYCTGANAGTWSGNFLNWSAMARIDVVRKTLYGGLRVTDTQVLTVLERTVIPTDVHAWSKFYSGSLANDISKLTPFNVSSTPNTYVSATGKTIRSVASITRTTRSITQITGAGTTATVTTSAAHGFAVGTVVLIAGADQPLYNGVYAIASTPSGTTFTYTTLAAAPANSTNAGMSASSSLATVTSNAHGFANSNVVVITGADQLGFNGAYTISGVTANTFQYTAATPAGADSTNAGISATIQGTTLSGIVNSGALRNILVGDQVRAVQTTNAANTITGTVTAVTGNSVTFNVDGSTGGSALTIGAWTITNLSSNGISICNVTQATTGSTETTAAPPLMRAVVGNFGLWHVIDGRECRWSGEGGGANGNRAFFSELNANQNSPAQTATGSGGVALGSGSGVGEFIVRVKVCDPALLGQEKCLNYPGNPASGGGVWKPVGLLQDYASSNNRKIKFGLFTGSFSKNASGGVLRKNAAFLDTASPVGTTAPVGGDEIDTRDGTFTGTDGMIKTLNRLRIFGYDYAAGNYGADSDSCNSPGLLAPADDTCSSWGNPISEIYSETLRYLAGKAVNTAFTPTPPAAGAFAGGGLTKDGVLGLNVQGWQDPLASANFCAPLNVVVFNASVNSYDNDQAQINTLQGAPDVKLQTKSVGVAEGITATSTFLIGDKGNSVAATAGPGGICTPKLFDQPNGLGDVMGICPEAPALKGSYLISGAAYWAHTNKIRTDIAVPATDRTSLKVKTYGISLNTAVPKMVIPVPGTGALATPAGSVPAKFITLLPTGKTLNGGSYRGGGTITDFKVVRQDLAAGTGKFFVSWEDSLQGNDYDLDQWGVISYQFVNGNTQIKVTSQVIYASAGFSLGFGFIISGTRNVAAGNTNTDGEHLLSAHKGNTQVDYLSVDGVVECVDCKEADGARSRTFDLATTQAATVLNEPLFYAAKYGGFNDLNANNLPDQTTEWDNLLANGSAGTDGIPDNFFQVTNPAALESSMDRAFIFILQVSSASSVATNSTSLNTGSRVYQARFNSNEWSGQLLSFVIDVNGVIDPVPTWDAGQKMAAFGSRIIVTYNPGAVAGTSATPAGIPFRFNNLTTAQQTFMNTDGGSGAIDAAGTVCASDQNPLGCTVRGPIRLNWLRGDQSNEGASATRFRVRPTTVLGDIVNSTPRYVGQPSQSFPDASYIAFKSSLAGRTPMLYVGGNDGMLHAFEATTGASGGVERMAYVPNKMFPSLTKLSAKSYSHRYYVDGSPTVNDACLGACAAASDWKTVLVGGFNAGEQGYYALDVTNPALWTDETQAARTVMWEFSDANDADLGFSYSKPLIAKMANGRWAAIFGNGYNSSTPVLGETLCTSGGTGGTPFSPAGCTAGYTGHAYIYVLFLDGGTDGVWTPGVDFIKISTNTGTNLVLPSTLTPGNPNGLATPVLVDTNGDGLTDFIYAGDLVGNMWKFDVRSASPSAWAVASAGIPLFIAQDAAGNRQPITSAPTLFPNPAGGFMVLFGTGKYLETGDDTGPYTQTNSMYGIWDRLDGTTVTRSQLMIQKVLNATFGNPTGELTVTIGTTTSTVRITSAFQPNYTATLRTNAAGTFGDPDLAPPGPNVVDRTSTTPASQNGWALDLPNSADGGPPSSVNPGTGEKVVFDPIISTGKVIFVTLLPSNVPCQAGGTSFIMDLDPVTGSRLLFSPFDLNSDTTFNSSDFVPFGGTFIPVTGLKSTIGIVPQPTVISAQPGKEIKVLSGSSGGLSAILENAPSGAPAGTRTGRRITWRELLSD
jgi:type IV pilus assembly protein PilY1